MTLLVNSIEEDIGSNYMCYHTTMDLWDNVNQMYSDLGNQYQVYELALKLEEIRQGEDSVTKYFNSLKRLWQDLDLFNDYEWKCHSDCNHYKKTLEDNRIFKFLIGLNVVFDEVRGRIIGKQSLLSLEEVSLMFAVKRAAVLSCWKKGARNPVENSAIAAGLSPSRGMGRSRATKTVSGVTIVTSHAIRVRHAGKYMENQKVGRAVMKENLRETPLYMRLVQPLQQGAN
ncbi:hypothetical protein HRI_004615400 [Hibiscus trionum]|uniref:Retrotransposon gag domain-containing protein n=1 Tax=Hibiscus trionum TaxID=183268 RepID=A0A9W7MQZ3_HIBTR|nr:hypothetical protein HRI_004615400 [Hibiscus trionum]